MTHKMSKLGAGTYSQYVDVPVVVEGGGRVIGPVELAPNLHVLPLHLSEVDGPTHRVHKR